MQLSDAANEKLERWLGAWPASGHASDEERWFDFVRQYHQDHGNPFEESAVRDLIQRREVSESGDLGDRFRNVIARRCNDARVMIDYLAYISREH